MFSHSVVELMTNRRSVVQHPLGFNNRSMIIQPAMVQNIRFSSTVKPQTEGGDTWNTGSTEFNSACTTSGTQGKKCKIWFNDQRSIPQLSDRLSSKGVSQEFGNLAQTPADCKNIYSGFIPSTTK